MIDGHRKRLCEARELCLQRGLATWQDDGFVWHVKAAFVCLDQEGPFATIRDYIPRLCTGTIVWELVKDRLLTSEELWLSMGWPVPGLLPADCTSDFPHAQFTDFTRRQHSVLLGNSVHVHMAGAVVLSALMRS